ncbi:nitroreductase family protein [Streptomyces sedi]|uniref:nitroreductase family protein n=1 Tax=Streptomyces sedi TaxID=555059 RepID=UPI0014773749|nr:nitroreductase family protein [Streptomyces sedi]
MPLIPASQAAEALTEAVRRRDPVGPRPAGGGEENAPAPAAGWAVGLAEVLAGRRSVRAFGPSPLEPGPLWEALAVAAADQRRQWPAARHGDAGLRLLVAARRVTGVAEGLYEGAPDGAPLAEAPDGLAEDYADAPALVFVCGGGTANAPRATPELLVRAGALGYAVWLAARTRGLECSVYGAAHAGVRRVAARARPGARHLFTVAVGHRAR